MKKVFYFLVLFFLLISCQKEKLLPNISFSYEISENGLLNGQLILDDSNYEVDYGDGSLPEVGTAFSNTPIILKHEYDKKGTFIIKITATNKNGTSIQNKQIAINSIAPSADFKYSLEADGTLNINFIINRGDTYELDFGDGQIKKETINDDKLPKNFSYSLFHQYKNNGNFKVTLTISNLDGSDKKEQSISITNIPIADFSYEILGNGNVKLTNLSKNATTYKWFITHYSTINAIQYANYISSEKDINITVDLSGYYFVRLDVVGKQTAISSIQKVINVTGLKKQMEFSGFYDGKKISGSLESNQLSYNFGWITFTGKGLYQSILPQDSFKTLYIKFYPLLFGQNSPQEKIDANPEYRYARLKEYFAESKDPDIIEILEETLDPQFYNNTENFYPKAFWVKYKIKNDILDGELKVRILVYGVLLP